MSRYHGIANTDRIKSVITPSSNAPADPITFKKQSKMEKSFNVSGGSDGTTNVRKSGVGEY